LLLAHIGGGFLYLVLSALRPATMQSMRHYRAHLLQSILAFAATSAVLLYAHGFAE
jgi:hypothetical protein